MRQKNAFEKLFFCKGMDNSHVTRVLSHKNRCVNFVNLHTYFSLFIRLAIPYL